LKQFCSNAKEILIAKSVIFFYLLPGRNSGKDSLTEYFEEVVKKNERIKKNKE